MNHNCDSIYDVIVVGGGPGGSTAATLVAMQGHRVLLIEREAMPTYKVGESLLPATVHGICPMLGVSDALKAANFVPKLGGTFRWGKGDTTWSFLFSASSNMPGPTSTAYQVERMKFDKILLDNAKEKGVNVQEQHSVTELISQGNRVVGVKFKDEQGVARIASARYVVDASGHQTPIARYAGERIYSEFFQHLALFGYYRGGKRLPRPNQGNIFCAAFDHGWFWYIPLSETMTSVGAVVAKEHALKLTSGYEHSMDEFIRNCPPIRELLSDATRITDGPYGKLRVRKDYSYTHTRFWIPGLVLVGDSACFIDPVFSSGVHLATYSGLLAARSINTSLAGTLDEGTCFTEFEQRYRREYTNFYDFLLAFYDVDSDLDSYYWHARKVTKSPEQAGKAFIDLVAGVGGSGEQLYTSVEDFVHRRSGLGDAIFPKSVSNGTPPARANSRGSEFYNNLLGEISQIQMQAMLKDRRPTEKPLFPGGLIPSSHGLHWTMPTI